MTATIGELDSVLASADIATLAASLRDRPGIADGERALDAGRAGVALVLRVAGSGLELLLIRRAVREGDPWSGHVSLPGGRWEVRDADLSATAVRETREETGIDLLRHGRLLGRLDDMRPSARGLPSIVVSPFVAVVAGSTVTAPSAEVAATFWVPLSALRDRTLWRDTPPPPAYGLGRAFVYGEHVVWGLTARLISQLTARLG